MAPGECWFPSPLLELCSSLLSAIHTQVVCIYAEATLKGKGLGVPSLTRDEAAELLEPCGSYGHFPESLLVGKGALNDQKSFSSTDHMNTPFVCREATGAGIAGQHLLPFTCGSSKALVVSFFFLPLFCSLVHPRRRRSFS